MGYANFERRKCEIFDMRDVDISIYREEKKEKCSQLKLRALNKESRHTDEVKSYCSYGCGNFQGVSSNLSFLPSWVSGVRTSGIGSSKLL